ncbi:MAG: endolytic transglycosylase MltG [Oscillospiraceae bacterium]|nr:endolytic transglycosylase MltG [Oscillospiraceae bacterium]
MEKNLNEEPNQQDETVQEGAAPKVPTQVFSETGEQAPPTYDDDADDDSFFDAEAEEAANAATYEDEELAPEDVYDYREERRARRRRAAKVRRQNKRARSLSCALVLLTLICASATLLSVFILAVAKEIYGIDKDISPRIVTIAKGSSTQDIAEQLEREHIISLPQGFRLISRLKGMDGQYIAGEHELTPSMSYESMIKELTTNHEKDRKYVTVTFPEGLNLLEIADILEQNKVCDKDKFLFYFNKAGYGFSFEDELPDATPLKFYRMEGYCFPDTYEFYVHEDAEIVAQKIYQNFDNKITASDYVRMKELGMTLDQVITLASIVQAEAPYLEEMKKVASVFHNRLNNTDVFSSLQSDPTKKYAEQVIHYNNQIYNQAMEESYNTYIGTGLPPGAINNPGRDAIEAVLYPADTPYFFFNANVDTREVFYAITNEEHNANVAKVKADQQAAKKNK